jgi:hypothetical protein
LFFLQPSQKRLLSSLNPVFLVGFVWALILVRTTMEPLLPNLFRQWDVLLPFMVYFGQRRSLPEGLILSLFTSHLYSLSSIAPIGVFTSLYLVLFLIARLLSYVIYANQWFSIMLLMFSLSITSRIVLTIIASSFGHGWSLFASGNFIWWSLLFNAGIGYLTYTWLELLDRFTYKAPRLSIELAEGGL